MECSPSATKAIAVSAAAGRLHQTEALAGGRLLEQPPEPAALVLEPHVPLVRDHRPVARHHRRLGPFIPFATIVGLHFDPIGVEDPNAGDDAVTGSVPFATYSIPYAPWAPPGNYTVRLKVDGQTYTQPLTVRLDPRVKTS